MYQVAIFIDGGYLDKVVRHEFDEAKIDFRSLSDAIVTAIHPSADIFRTYYYHCLPYKSSPPTQEESERFSAAQNFMDAINRLPRFTVRYGRLARRGPDRNGKFTFEQKMVDVYLSIDLVHMSLKSRITHAAIVAGDSDFVPAIELARNEGICTWLFHGDRSNVHQQLWDLMDERVRINDDLIHKVRWQNSR
jgi:uncharacterized LabA/DUF88 family protein